MHLQAIRGPDIPITSVPVYPTGAGSVWDSQAVRLHVPVIWKQLKRFLFSR